jgi:hypothetical protein
MPELIGWEARIGQGAIENFFNNNLFFNNNFDEKIFDECQNWPGRQNYPGRPELAGRPEGTFLTTIFFQQQF